MKIVYAKPSTRRFDFYVTEERQTVPTDATVVAICTGERVMQNQDENLFDTISDEDKFALRATVSEAQQLELQES